MSNYEVIVKDGPSEATLVHATDGRAPVVFRVDEGVLEARLDAVEDLRDEAGLAISGSIVSGPYQGQTFVGSYDAKRRRGCLKLQSVP
jgi:hypothetical protein